MKIARLSLLLVVLVSILTAPAAFGGGKNKSGTLSFNSSLVEGCDYTYSCSNGSSGVCCSGLSNCCDTCNTACQTTCGGLCPAS